MKLKRVESVIQPMAYREETIGQSLLGLREHDVGATGIEPVTPAGSGTPL